MVQCEHLNLERKRFINSTCEEFAEFFEGIISVKFERSPHPSPLPQSGRPKGEGENTERLKEYNRKVLFENFKKEYEDFEEIKLTKFTRWLKEAGRIKNFKVSERKSGSDRFIPFLTSP